MDRGDSQRQSSHTTQATDAVPDWQRKKQLQQLSKEYDLDRYVCYSFNKNFRMNNREIEIFEPCKILGDVFEALIGAIFIDSAGMKEVLRVFQHLLSPFLLHVAKFSKKLSKEPKEEFQILSNLHKIAPDMVNDGDVYYKVGQLDALVRGDQVQPLTEQEKTQLVEA